MIYLASYSGGGLGKSNGTEKTPKLAEKLLQNLDETGKPFHLETKEIKTYPDDFTKTLENVEREVTGKFVLIGGDHSLTYAAFKKFASEHKNAGIVVFDAHPDLMQSFTPATHENWLRMIIEEGIVKPENVILIAIRNIDKEEWNAIKKNKLKHYTMKEIAEEGIKETTENIMSAAKEFGALYISVDVDACDPAFAIVGYPEPGGLTSRELLYMISKLKILKNYVSGDVVEAMPESAALSAKIATELC